MCKFLNKPIEHNDPAPSPNSEFPVYEAEEEEFEEIPDEISRLLEQEDKTLEPYKEPMELINLGTEEDNKEVWIGALEISTSSLQLSPHLHKLH